MPALSASVPAVPVVFSSMTETTTKLPMAIVAFTVMARVAPVDPTVPSWSVTLKATQIPARTFQLLFMTACKSVSSIP